MILPIKEIDSYLQNMSNWLRIGDIYTDLFQIKLFWDQRWVHIFQYLTKKLLHCLLHFLWKTTKHSIWDKVFKNGPSKVWERHPLKTLKVYGFQILQRMSFTSFTWSILEYFVPYVIFRSRCLETISKKAVLKNIAKLTKKYLCWSLFLIKVASYRATTLLIRDFDTRVFLRILQDF